MDVITFYAKLLYLELVSENLKNMTGSNPAYLSRGEEPVPLKKKNLSLNLADLLRRGRCRLRLGL